MNILNRLTILNLKKNPRRTSVTIIGIVLAVALITAVASMASSFQSSYISYAKSYEGDYHYSFSSVPYSDLTYFENNRNIEKLTKIQAVGFSPLPEGGSNAKKYLYLVGGTENDLKNATYRITEGRFPEKDGEIVISSDYRINGKEVYAIGDVITLHVGHRYNQGTEQTIDYSYDAENETWEEEFTKQYTVVGYGKQLSYDYSGTAGYTCFVYNDTSSGLYTVYARYTSDGLKNEYKVTANILNIDEDLFTKASEGLLKNDDLSQELSIEIMHAKYQYYRHGNLINAETLKGNDTVTSMFEIAALIGVIIMITSIFCIKNSFDISTTENIRQYGILRSIGATSKQIKHTVRQEAFLLSCIGIPLGLLLGLLFSFLLVNLSQNLLENMYQMTFRFSVSPLIIIFSILFSFLTIMISASRSARRASKIEPITAIRRNEDIKIAHKALKMPRYIRSLFGISGVVAFKNMKRDRRKYRTTVLSIIICTASFISLSYVFESGSAAAQQNYGNLKYNIFGSFNKDSNIDIKQDIQTVTSSIQSSDLYSLEYNEDIYVPDFNVTDEYIQSIDENNLFEKDRLLHLMVLDDSSYSKYLEKLGLNETDCVNKGILVNTVQVTKDGKTEEVQITNYKTGDVLPAKTMDVNAAHAKDYNVMYSISNPIELAAVTAIRPDCYQEGINAVVMIVSKDLIDTFNTDQGNVFLLINASDPDKTLQDLNSLGIDSLQVNSLGEEQKKNNNMIILFSVFLYGFIAVIAMIGITSIINTVTSNMNLRRNEFASFKSIGMTQKEFNQMVSLESFLYCSRSLLFGIPIGLGLSGVIYAVMKQAFNTGYIFPYKAVIISIIAVAILLFSIMRLTITKINQQNVIETIRNENI